MHQIKNLVVNGCSFTDDRANTTWATFLSRIYSDKEYFNIASRAAGNDYIANSTVRFLQTQKLNPSETLVIIMWSGVGRKDIKISGEWWYHLIKSYPVGRDLAGDYYVFSGGMSNSWKQNSTTVKIFDWLYKLSDPEILCQESLMNFFNLQNYLNMQGYHYRFTNYVNCWDNINQSNPNGGDYSIAYFCANDPIYKYLDFSKWVFVNDQHHCLSELAQSMDQLDHTGHPTELAHKKFADDIMMPHLEKNFSL